MCGFVALVGEWPAETMQTALGCIRHRGPDGEGCYKSENLKTEIGAVRLSIIDIPGGAQPLENPKRKSYLVWNGEIFNAPEIRLELTKSGIEFSSDHSDSEALLHFLDFNGIAAIPELNGMFSLVYLNEQTETLVISRDRFGIKPLFLWRDKTRLIFASEQKSIISALRSLPEIDQEAIGDYLQYGYLLGEQSGLVGISQFEPGTICLIDLKDLTEQKIKYWKPSTGLTKESQILSSDVSRRIEDELQQSISRWTTSDVNVGYSLSGGLDSSLIVAIASRASERPLRTYSVIYPDRELRNLDESHFARLVSEKCKTQHTEITITPENLLMDLPQMMHHLEMPYGGGLPSWYVYKSMAGIEKVAITGTGADELFGNYGKWIRVAERIGKRSSVLNNTSIHFGLRYHLKSLMFKIHNTLGIENTALASSLFKQFQPVLSWETAYPVPSMMTHTEAGLSLKGRKVEQPQEKYFRLKTNLELNEPLDLVCNLDFQNQLPNEFLSMTDRFSMAFSIEARTPYLDTRLVDLVLGLPVSLRGNGEDPKHLLREIGKKYLPSPLIHGKKKGFELPLDLWLATDLWPFCRGILLDRDLDQLGHLNTEFIQSLVFKYEQGQVPSQKIWVIFMLKLWLQEIQKMDLPHNSSLQK
jgi:asparagine synthase (glutamine-hydrolysing)